MEIAPSSVLPPKTPDLPRNDKYDIVMDSVLFKEED